MRYKNSFLFIISVFLFFTPCKETTRFFVRCLKALMPDLQVFFNQALTQELFGCAKHHDEKIPLNLSNMQKLLDAGSDLDYENDHKITLFMAVILTDRITLAKKSSILAFLLTYKPDLEHKDNDGYTAFWYATHDQNVDIMKLLVAAGARIDYVVKGCTPFNYAVQNNLEQAAGFFIDIINQRLQSVSATIQQSPAVAQQVSARSVFPEAILGPEVEAKSVSILASSSGDTLDSSFIA